MDFFELLRYRKSIRAFAETEVSQDELAKILAAANAAPVGSNRYADVHLTVVNNRDILDKLSEAAVKRRQNKELMEKIVGSSQRAHPEVAKYDPFYGAKTVIFVSHREQDLQPGIEFSNVACIVYSMHLAAASLGLASVFMWFALESMREIKELDNTALLNLPDGFQPLLGIAIGHPKDALTEREIKTDKISINYL